MNIDKDSTDKKLQEIEELVLKEQEALENKIPLEVQFAKENSNSDKEAALAACKRKKLYEKQLTEVDSALTRIEILREFVSNDGRVEWFSSGHGAASRENTLALKDIDGEVAETVRDISEQLEKLRENTLAISNNTARDDFEEDELKKELEDMHVQQWTGLGGESNELTEETPPSQFSNLEDNEEFEKLQSWAV